MNAAILIQGNAFLHISNSDVVLRMRIKIKTVKLQQQKRKSTSSGGQGKCKCRVLQQHSNVTRSN